MIPFEILRGWDGKSCQTPSCKFCSGTTSYGVFFAYPSGVLRVSNRMAIRNIPLAGQKVCMLSNKCTPNTYFWFYIKLLFSRLFFKITWILCKCTQKYAPTTGPVLLRQGEPATSQYNLENCNLKIHFILFFFFTFLFYVHLSYWSQPITHVLYFLPKSFKIAVSNNQIKEQAK